MRRRSWHEVVKEEQQRTCRLQRELAARIGPDRFQLWFDGQTRLHVHEQRLTVFAASAMLRDWLRKSFLGDLQACTAAVAGGPLAVEFEIDSSLHALRSGGESASSDEAVSPQSAERSATDVDQQQPSIAGRIDSSHPAVPLPKADANGHAGPRNGHEHSQNGASRANARPESASRDGANQPPATKRKPSPTLAEYVVGPSNALAASSADLVARGLHQASPVLFWGPTGVGKTHLLRAICGGHRRHHARRRAVYLTAEQFTSAFIEALRGAGLPSFRQKCRSADLLLVDDLHFFVGKRATVEELQHTIDSLTSLGHQIVFSSDRPPGDLQPLGEELRSRLAGGLACQIGLPEYSVRLEITRRLAAQIGGPWSDAVLVQVAGRIEGGARELRGALNLLAMTAVAHGETLTPARAEETLGELSRQTARPVRLADIQRAVCSVFDVEPGLLRSESRARSVSEPRMLAVWLARKHTQVSWSEIAEFFGRRSHSTVISAHRRMTSLIDSRAKIGVSAAACQVEEAIRRVEAELRTA